jgi:phosphoribosylanthranilate isomerase
MADVSLLVKICGITNEEDARAAVEAGADALGFNFYAKSPRCITPERACQIVAAVPGRYLRVGVFVNASEKELLETAAKVPLDVLQLHGETGPLRSRTPLRLWRSVAPDSKTYASDPMIEAYLLDTPTPEFGGSGKTFDWTLAQHRTGRIILAGGLDSANVAEAVRTVKPWGVDACSRLESSPGKKNAQEMRAFVRAARLASQNPIEQLQEMATGSRKAEV